MSCLNTMSHPNNGRWRVQINPPLNVPSLLPGKIVRLFFFRIPKPLPLVCTQKIFNEVLKRQFKVYIWTKCDNTTHQLILRWRRHFLNQILRASDGRTLHVNREFYKWISVFFFVIQVMTDFFAKIKATVSPGIIWGFYYNCHTYCGFTTNHALEEETSKIWG